MANRAKGQRTVAGIGEYHDVFVAKSRIDRSPSGKATKIRRRDAKISITISSDDSSGLEEKQKERDEKDRNSPLC